MLSIKIAKFKFHQYQMRAISPNLMYTKFTSYTALYCVCTVHVATVCCHNNTQYIECNLFIIAGMLF